jgi:hypothetical protein
MPNRVDLPVDTSRPSSAKNWRPRLTKLTMAVSPPDPIPRLQDETHNFLRVMRIYRRKCSQTGTVVARMKRGSGRNRWARAGRATVFWETNRSVAKISALEGGDSRHSLLRLLEREGRHVLCVGRLLEDSGQLLGVVRGWVTTALFWRKWNEEEQRFYVD